MLDLQKAAASLNPKTEAEFGDGADAAGVHAALDGMAVGRADAAVDDAHGDADRE
jgi:hypothetical protein